MPPALSSSADKRLARYLGESNVRATNAGPGNWIAVAGAAGMAIALVVWLAPWLPFGMEQEDYTHAVRIALMLAAGTALLSFLALLSGAGASANRDVVDLLQQLIGRSGRLRNRQQFARRLASACGRARGDRRAPLALFLVQVSPKGGAARLPKGAIDYVGQSLAASVRSNDVIGLVRGDEIGVLIVGASAAPCDAIRTRIEEVLLPALAEWNSAQGPASVIEISVGGASYGPGNDPQTLMAAARRTVRPLAAGAGRAA